jgi:hypothetical protein
MMPLCGQADRDVTVAQLTAQLVDLRARLVCTAVLCSSSLVSSRVISCHLVASYGVSFTRRASLDQGERDAALRDRDAALDVARKEISDARTALSEAGRTTDQLRSELVRRLRRRCVFSCVVAANGGSCWVYQAAREVLLSDSRRTASQLLVRH